jgi:phospholipase/carboxylesterase
LHGTGGTESDLLPLGAAIAPGAAMLAPRGKVLENGMPRFFRRVAEGIFDREDLKIRTFELNDFLTRAREHYGIERPIAVGFSNGANIGWSLLLSYPDALAGAVLLRGMLPFDPSPLPDLSGIPVQVLAGNEDPIVDGEAADRVAAVLGEAGAAVDYDVLAAGHGLTPQDVVLARRWYEALSQTGT